MYDESLRTLPTFLDRQKWRQKILLLKQIHSCKRFILEPAESTNRDVISISLIQNSSLMFKVDKKRPERRNHVVDQTMDCRLNHLEVSGPV